MTIDSFVTGEIKIPESVRYSHSEEAILTIALQDTSRMDRPAIEISKLCMELSYLGYSTIPFAFSYQPAKLDSETNEWYTLRVRIESKRDGQLLCFNHRVTRAIDDSGLPHKNMKIQLVHAATRRRKTVQPTIRQMRSNVNSEHENRAEV
jgi:uncharacterized lipoprotein YbaY